MNHLGDSDISTVTLAVGAVTATAVAGALYYLSSAGTPQPGMEHLKVQSIEVAEGVRGSVYRPDGTFLSRTYDDVTTMYEVFLHGLEQSDNGPCLATRSGPNLSYEWISYQEVLDRARAFGSWLSEEGIATGTETIVGIYSQNRTEWQVASLSCSMFSRVVTALYDTLGADSCKFIMAQTEMPVLVCDKADKANKILEDAADLTSLKYIVVMDTIDKVDMQKANKHDVKIIQFSEAVAKGRDCLKDAVLPKPTDLAVIIYTSGTTGNPKGVMLTQGIVVADLAGVMCMLTKSREINKEDRVLSYLPLAHMFEFLSEQVVFLGGGRVGFFRGDVTLLAEDAQALKPTIFPVVPRLLNKLYDKVLAGVQASKVKSALFRWALAAKKKQIEKSIFRRDTFWDRLVFRKVQDLFGGCITIMVTGSAPLEEKVLTFVRCAFGCDVFEAYGQTEATACISATAPGEFKSGHVGGPIPCNHIKLVDVPEYDYYVADGKGEICAKGTNLCLGYYKNPEKTAELLDSDGWMHTGDIGTWLPNGTLRIIDRKKNIFKLAQGEYVAPEKIEIAFTRSSFVAQVFVEGDSLQPYLMCVVVPDEEVLMPWAKKKGIPGDFKDLCQNEVVKSTILEDINKVGRDLGLKGFELAKDVALCAELFSIENNLLTPTFKSKRPELRKRFQGTISELYKKHVGPGFHRQQSQAMIN